MEHPRSVVGDHIRFGPIPVVVTTLCALVAMLDGFDTQAIAYVAPTIAQDWSMESSSMGPVFAAGLIGSIIGALGLSLAADRFGRKIVIVVSTLIFGLFSLMTAFVHGLNDLLILRVLTGIGLGGALPNIIALTSEYAPARWRATVVTVMSCGFPLGAMLSGLIASPLIAAFGWPAIFIIGGIAPLLLLPVLLLLLPESIRFLATRGGRETQIARILSRIDPQAPPGEFATRLIQDAPPADKTLPAISLFKEGRAAATLLLWSGYIMALMVMYLMVNWMPTLLYEAGLSMRIAIYSTAIWNLGGIAGAVLVGRLIDRWNPSSVLGYAFAISALFIVSVGLVRDAPGLLLACAALSGFGIVGASIGCNALAASLYPTTMRATGVGWGVGIGRIGAVLGPLVGGALLAAQLQPHWIIVFAAAPALCAAASMFALGMVQKARQNQAAAAAHPPHPVSTSKRARV